MTDIWHVDIKCGFQALYLDWADVVGETGDHDSLPGLDALSRSNVMLAADVIYDHSVIPRLVRLIKFFLESQPFTSSPKTVLLAATLRNASSLELLMSELTHCRIAATLIASGQDCENLPKLFSTTFVQPRSDVRIYALHWIPP